jgi:hypothetical protein
MVIIPPNHLERAYRLANLGVSFRSRFKRIGDLNDLNKAISRGEEAMTTIPPNHTLRSMVL